MPDPQGIDYSGLPDQGSGIDYSGLPDQGEPEEQGSLPHEAFKAAYGSLKEQVLSIANKNQRQQDEYERDPNAFLAPGKKLEPDPVTAGFNASVEGVRKGLNIEGIVGAGSDLLSKASKFITDPYSAAYAPQALAPELKSYASEQLDKPDVLSAATHAPGLIPIGKPAFYDYPALLEGYRSGNMGKGIGKFAGSVIGLKALEKATGYGSPTETPPSKLKVPEETVPPPPMRNIPTSKFDPKTNAYLIPGPEKGVSLPETSTPGTSKMPLHRNLKGDYRPSFGYDLEEALWIAGQQKPGKRHTEALNYIIEEAGVDSATANTMSKDFKTKVKTYLDAQEPGEHTVPSVFDKAPEQVPKAVPRKPNVFRNQDGTYTDTETGITYDNKGNQIKGEQPSTVINEDQTITDKTTGQMYDPFGRPTPAATVDIAKPEFNPTLPAADVELTLPPTSETPPVEASKIPVGRISEIQRQNRISWTQAQAMAEAEARGEQPTAPPNMLDTATQTPTVSQDLPLNQQNEKVTPEPDIAGATPIPSRTLRINRGAHDPVRVIFPDEFHAHLFSAIGRARRQMRGESFIDPAWSYIANKLGVDNAEAYRLANEYRNHVLSLTKAQPKFAPEGTNLAGTIYAPGIKEVEVPEGGLGPSSLEPEAARVRGGRAKFTTNVQNDVLEMTKGYSMSMPSAMTREGMQNAIDAIKTVTGGSGNVHVVVDDNGISIEDNGKGMTRAQMYKLYTTMHESGKLGEEGATGGKGVGKASYIFGGKYFSVRSIAEYKGGMKIESSFEGTPEELISKPFHITHRLVDPSTPTGTYFRTDFKPEQIAANAARDARVMMNNIRIYSRDIPGTLSTVSDYGKEHGKAFKSFKDDKLIADKMLDNGNDKVQVYIPDGVAYEEGHYLKVDVLNNGMYQYTEDMYIGDDVRNKPERVTVNIQPQVPELHDDYPFNPSREGVKNRLQSEIDDLITHGVVDPLKEQRRIDLVKLWNGMEAVPGTLRSRTSGREVSIFDPGNRLLPNEKQTMLTDPTNRRLMISTDNIIDEILKATGHQDWMDRVTRTGTYFDPGTYGYHIPDPNSNGARSAIFLNYLQHFASKSPRVAANDAVMTLLHEVAHVGEQKGEINPLDYADVNDPRLGEFVKAIVKEQIEQGGISQGHHSDFLARLSEVAYKYGPTKYFDAADQFYDTVADGSGNYRPEVQRLLHIYNERARRNATTEDILSPTGVKQANVPPRPPIIPGNTQGSGKRAPWNEPKRSKSDPLKSAKPPGWKRELYELGRGTSAAWDISAPFRQGIGLVGSREWFKSYIPMFKAMGSEAAFREVTNKIEQLPVVRSGIAKDSGLFLSDLSSKFSKREEVLRSNWAEKIPGIRASNRAYTAYLNNLRAETFQKLYDNATPEFKNTPGNLKLLARYVNDATGRGKYEFGVGSHKVNLEHNAKLFGDTFFSARLMASRVRMLNPGTYVFAPKYVRMQYLKSLVRMGTAWLAFNQLGKFAGGETTDDPTSADFGKIRFGNTRLDPAGGFQQYLVLAARLASGRFTSSLGEAGEGRQSTLGQGFRAPTGMDVATQFISGKLHPSIKFAYDLLDASHYKPFGVMDRTAQMYVPMIVGDLATIYQEDPSLLPIGALAAAGMGAQTYEKGGNKPVYLDPENDFTYEGGGGGEVFYEQ